MTTYFERQLKEFDHAIHSMDMELFERWVKEGAETLKNGHKIIASGLGKNVPVCEKFVGSMQSLGLEACFLNTNSAVHGDMGVVKEGDMVIILTKSGETVGNKPVHEQLFTPFSLICKIRIPFSPPWRAAKSRPIRPPHWRGPYLCAKS